MLECRAVRSVMTFTSRKLRYEGIFCFSYTGKASTFEVMKTSAPDILLCLFSCLTLGKNPTQPRGHLTCTRHKTLEYKSVLPAELISLYIDGMCPSVGRIAACSCWGSVQIAWWRSVHSGCPWVSARFVQCQELLPRLTLRPPTKLNLRQGGRLLDGRETPIVLMLQTSSNFAWRACWEDVVLRTILHQLKHS